MLSKRRITVTHVDDAILCGGEGSFHHIVSLFNGADHTLKTPVPVESPPQPSVSRLLAHTFHGAVEVDVQLSPSDEYVLTASANEAGVVACRVCPAPPSTGFSRRAAWTATSAHRLVFFSGRQRLAEVVLDAKPSDEVPTSDDEAQRVTTSGSTKASWQATYEQWRDVYRRFPIQCVRAANGVDMALLVTGPHVLCACTPSAAKEQYLTLPRSPIACVGAGRQGRGEATVLLEDGTVLLCGLQTTAPAHAHGQNGASEDSSRESSLYRVRGSFAGTTPSASPALPPKTVPLSADMAPEVQQTASAYLADAADAADHASNLAVLSVRTLPARSSSSSSAAALGPRQLVWAGRQTLWVVYEDGLVRAFWWPVPTARHAANEAEQDEDHDAARVVFEGRLGAANSTSVPEQVVLSTDPRTPTLHYGYRTRGDSSGNFHYGSIKLSYSPSAAAAPAAGAPTYEHTASLEYTALFSETVYGIRLHAGRFHVISQARRGANPLYVSGLPRGNPVHAAALAGMDPSTDVPLHQHILWDAESQLAAHCQRCSDFLHELGDGDATGSRYGSTEAEVQDALAQLHSVAHSIHALLIRSRSAEGVIATDSYPYQLLQRVHAHEARLLAVQLLVRCSDSDSHGGGGDADKRPLSLQTSLQDLLDMAHVRATAASAQKELQALMESSTRSWAVAPGTAMQDESHHNPHATTASLSSGMVPERAQLCVDVLLRHVPCVAAVLDESRLTLASVLAASHAMGPALALFVVYCSYRGLTQETLAGGHGQDDAVFAQQEALRAEFLGRFNHPTSWATWALLAYAADHRLSLPAPPTPQSSDDAEGPRTTTATSSSAGLLATRLALAHTLGVPPFQDLLAPLVTGMMRAGAFDAAFHVLGTTLACFPAAARDLPAPLAQKLLFLAVQAGSTAMVEQLFAASRSADGQPQQPQPQRGAENGGAPRWSTLATQALAYTALTTQAHDTLANATARAHKSGAAAPPPPPPSTTLVKESCLESLRGFVPVASHEADAVEAVLHAHTDILQREYLLLRFYTLTQRYADAVQTCHRIASATPAEAQRIQVVASYLASLAPYENPHYMCRRTDGPAEARNGRTGTSASSSRAHAYNEEAAEASEAARQRGDALSRLSCVAPTPLESSDSDLRAQLALTVRRLSPSTSTMRMAGSGLIVSGAVPAAIVDAQSANGRANERYLRPSSLLASVERVPTSERASSTATGAGASLLPPPASAAGAARRGHNGVSVNEEEEDGAVADASRLGAPTGLNVSLASGMSGDNTCEAIIQRNGHVCGRHRPCPYHDR